MFRIQPGHVQLTKSFQNVSDQELGTHAIDHLRKTVVMRLHLFHDESRPAEPRGVTLQRLCVADTCNPGQQALAFWQRPRCPREIADSDTTAWFEHAVELSRGLALVRERAEGALAHTIAWNVSASKGKRSASAS